MFFNCLGTAAGVLLGDEKLGHHQRVGIGGEALLYADAVVVIYLLADRDQLTIVTRIDGGRSRSPNREAIAAGFTYS